MKWTKIIDPKTFKVNEYAIKSDAGFFITRHKWHGDEGEHVFLLLRGRSSIKRAFNSAELKALANEIVEKEKK